MRVGRLPAKQVRAETKFQIAASHTVIPELTRTAKSPENKKKNTRMYFEYCFDVCCGQNWKNLHTKFMGTLVANDRKASRASTGNTVAERSRYRKTINKVVKRITQDDHPSHTLHPCKQTSNSFKLFVGFFFCFRASHLKHVMFRVGILSALRSKYLKGREST